MRRRTVRRQAAVAIAVLALAPGVVLLGVALADPTSTAVVVTAPDGSTTPTVVPSVLTVTPGGQLQFSLATGGASVRIVRSAAPSFAYSLTPGGTTSPLVLAASPTDLAYSVFPYSPCPMVIGECVNTESDGPTQTAEVLVTPSATATATGPTGTDGGAASAPAASSGAGSTAAPTTLASTSASASPSPTAHATSARASRATPSRSTSSQSASSPPGAHPSAAHGSTVHRSAAPTAGATPSHAAPSVDDLPTAEVAPPPPVLVLPSAVPRFSASPGSSPQIYDPHASGAPQAAGVSTPPAASVAPGGAATATVLAAAVPVTGIAGEPVAARERGLPVAIAAVLLLGVGGAVGRAVTAVTRARGRSGS